MLKILLLWLFHKKASPNNKKVRIYSGREEGDWKKMRDRGNKIESCITKLRL